MNVISRVGVDLASRAWFRKARFWVAQIDQDLLRVRMTS